MEPTELRIGNYVSNQKGNFKGEPIGSPVKLELKHFNKWLSMYVPIPITEEWLLKLNFKKWKNKKIWTIHNVLIYYHTKHGFCYGKANTRTKIKYIHTLQNIIHSLAGKELTINEQRP